jgi:aminopeptidase N
MRFFHSPIGLGASARLRNVSVATALLLVSALVNGTTAHVDVLSYDVQIEPNIPRQSIEGKVTIRFRAASLPTDELQLSAGSLDILKVQENGRSLAWQKAATTLSIALPRLATVRLQNDVRTVHIAYRGTPSRGIRFLPDAAQVFTAFATSEWMPCNEAPADRARIALSVVVPAAHKVVANGRAIGERRLRNGLKLSRWRQDKSVPSYLFGFAAGPFLEVIDRSAHPTLRHLVSPTFSINEVRQIFRETRSMMAFYESKSGVSYPETTYTQVLVATSAAQEVDGFALMSDAYGRRVLTDERRIWLGAHELSHQWWGNAVTNWSWREFWLNEGIATFMNAAYFEHRFGRDEYARHIAAAQMKYRTLHAAGKDASLVFPSWSAPSAEDRSLVYDKGAIVLHELRLMIGDEAFWAGLRRYTQQHWGRAVNTADFQRAMEVAAGRSLEAFFQEWVYLAPR